MLPSHITCTVLKALLSRHVVGAVMRALSRFPQDAVLQTKALVLLGVMVEGEDVLQEAVRQRLLEEGVIPR